MERSRARNKGQTRWRPRFLVVEVMAVLAGLAAGAWFGLGSRFPWLDRYLGDSRELHPGSGPSSLVSPGSERRAPSIPSNALVLVPVFSKEPPIPELAYPGLMSPNLAERNEALMREMADRLDLTLTEQAKVREIFGGSTWIGQGNPKITEHPMTRAQCRQIRQRAAPLPSGDPRCGAPNMVLLYDPGKGETQSQARVCIDQYEFPNLPCEYPVVWVKAREAVELCRAVGKRICDAHEWEGACAGALKSPEEEYAFGQRRIMMEYLHNKEREIVWAYGVVADQSRCATMSRKNPQCMAVDWGSCGSNTYPAGAFPGCRSSFGVFDQHGNVAEHMNLPLESTELASRGGLGQTEMKGGWFIFSSYEAHPDDCRWRALMWHASRIDDAASHRNYHLGFRCCRDVSEAENDRSASSLAPSSKGEGSEFEE